MNKATVTISLATTALLALPCLAANSDTATQPQFRLQAQVNERPQLSRDQLDPGSMHMTPAPVIPAAERQALSYAGVPRSGPPIADSRPLGQNKAHVDDAKSLMREGNVDWSRWIGSLADRWYYVLRHTEDSANVQFITVRPALFEFTCYANGQIGNITLKQSSGNPIYDHVQVVALMQTAPLPPFPPGTKRTSITLLQGWESHVRKPGENDYVPGSFGRNFPMEKVREWVTAK